jgi:Kae1-associated kinase Bud32
VTAVKAVMARGAEAVLEPARHLGREVLAKRRPAKGYRHAALDAALRDARTRDEANLLLAARQAGVPVPLVYDADRAGATILLEPIAGPTLRDQLQKDGAAVAERRLEQLGRLLARLHTAGLAHGDPTASNVLVPDPADPASLVLLDFGLGAFTQDEEERGVDLHLLEEALEATDARAAALMAAVLRGYGHGPIQQAALRRLEAIRERGRYR